MAQTIKLISGSPLIGSPIVLRVTPAPYSDSHTFHRVIARVYAGLETDEDYTPLEFSMPVETKPSGQSYATQPALFDISSALQAVADKYEYEATPPSRYPYIKFRVEAWDEWMVDGTLVPRQGIVEWPSPVIDNHRFYAYAFMGAWTDLERLGAGVDQQGVEYLDTEHMSRKPNSTPEVVFIDTAFIYPADFQRSIFDTDRMSGDATPEFISGAPTDGPKSLSNTPDSEGAVTVGGHNLYVIDKPLNGYLLRFVNGMGCLESLCVTSLVKREAKNKTTTYNTAKIETLKNFSRSVTINNDGPETWYLTSGALDREWASWYVHEFLNAKQMWIWLSSQWIPCHIVSSEEAIEIEDRSTANPQEVQFRIELDINGAPI